MTVCVTSICPSNCPSCSLNFPVPFFRIIHLHPSFSPHHSSYCLFPLPQHWLSVNTVCSWEEVNTPSISNKTNKTRWIVFFTRGFSLDFSLIEESAARSIHPLQFIEGRNHLNCPSHLFGLSFWRPYSTCGRVTGQMFVMKTGLQQSDRIVTWKHQKWGTKLKHYY